MQDSAIEKQQGTDHGFRLSSTGKPGKPWSVPYYSTRKDQGRWAVEAVLPDA